MSKLILIFKWGFLLGLLFLVLSFVDNERLQKYVIVSEINIKDSENKFINKGMVKDLLTIKSKILDDSVRIHDFKLDETEEFLSNHPSIEDAEVFVSSKGEVYINIEQKEPLARVISKQGDYYLDYNGEIMPLSDNYTARLIVITGDVNKKNHYALLNLIRFINKNSFWRSQITQLHFNNQEVVLVPRVGSHKIHFGQLNKIKEKLDNLYHFYKEGMPVKGWQTYSDISLKYNNQIICTKK